MAVTDPILSLTLTEECPIPNDINDYVVPGENAVVAYKSHGSTTILTTDRMILRGFQTRFSKKVESWYLPYTSIDLWSSESSETMNFDVEVELWTKAGLIKLTLRESIDARKFDRLIANALLG